MKHMSYYCEECGETMLPPFEDDNGNVSRTTCTFCGKDYKENINGMCHIWASSPYINTSLMTTIENHKHTLRKSYLYFNSKEVNKDNDTITERNGKLPR